MVVRVGLTSALLLAFGCGQSQRDGDRDAPNTSGRGGIGGVNAQGGDAGAHGGTGGASAGTGSGGTSAGVAGRGTGVNGGRDGGGNAGTLGSVAGGGADAAGGVAQAGSGGMGETGEAGAAGEGGHGGQPDVLDHDDFIVRSSAMAEYEGLTVYATFDHNIEPVSRSEPRSDVISDGSFELRWEQAFYRMSFGASVVLFVDRAGDGFCTEEVDPAWAALAGSVSTWGTPEVFDFDPELVPDGNLITCEEFNTWYGENFPGT